jgi:hypothetical protein
MAQPYSDDLRCKFLEAYEAGAGSLRELAEQFRIFLPYGKKIRVQQLRTGASSAQSALLVHDGEVALEPADLSCRARS